MWGCIAEATEADEDEQNSRSHRRHPTHAGTRIGTVAAKPLAFTGGAACSPETDVCPTHASERPASDRTYVVVARLR
jgi:hypothetical protein